jgi:hypothetical protein
MKTLNTQHLELNITLNRGKNLPKRVWKEIADAISERLEQCAGDTTLGDRLGVGHIEYVHKHETLEEYCGV